MNVTTIAEPTSQVANPEAVPARANGVAMAIMASRNPKTWRHIAWSALTWIASAGRGRAATWAAVPTSALSRAVNSLTWLAMAHLSPVLDGPGHVVSHRPRS